MKTSSLAHAELLAGEQQIAGKRRPSNRQREGRDLCKTAGAVALVVFGILLALSGCSSDNKPAAEKPEVKPPDPVSARSGFQKSYIAARQWNLDAKPYRIESVAAADANGRDGKWTVWRSSFGSPNAHSEKTFTWSGSNADGAPARGVNPGIEDSYSPTNASTTVFDVAFLKIDSEQALDTAMKHGGDKVLQEAPDTPVNYVCDWNRNTNQLVWHVIFGVAREGAKLVVSVDASTGNFIRVEK